MRTIREITWRRVQKQKGRVGETAELQQLNDTNTTMIYNARDKAKRPTHIGSVGESGIGVVMEVTDEYPTPSPAIWQTSSLRWHWGNPSPPGGIRRTCSTGVGTVGEEVSSRKLDRFEVAKV